MGIRHNHLLPENPAEMNDMGKNNYLVCREIAKDIQVRYEKEIPRSHVERMIREKLGGDAKTVEKYMRMLGDMEVIHPTKSFNVFNVLPANNTKPATPENLGILEASTAARKGDGVRRLGIE